MCGLAGLLDPTTTRSGDDLVQIAGSMADQLKHRGPDDRGVWADERSGLGFGHRRLSVVDLDRRPRTTGALRIRTVDSVRAIGWLGGMRGHGIGQLVGLVIRHRTLTCWALQ